MPQSAQCMPVAHRWMQSRQGWMLEGKLNLHSSIPKAFRTLCELTKTSQV